MSSLLDGFLERMEQQPRELREGEYLEADGLIYCEKCRTPRQCRKELSGRVLLLPCICKCQQEELKRKKEEGEARERMNLIHRLKATGIQERHLLDWRFDAAEDTPTIA